MLARLSENAKYELFHGGYVFELLGRRERAPLVLPDANSTLTYAFASEVPPGIVLHLCFCDSPARADFARFMYHPQVTVDHVNWVRLLAPQDRMPHLRDYTLATLFEAARLFPAAEMVVYTDTIYVVEPERGARFYATYDYNILNQARALGPKALSEFEWTLRVNPGDLGAWERALGV